MKNTFDEITAPLEQTIATGLARIFTVTRSQAWARAVVDGVTPTQADILALLVSRSNALRLSVIAEQLAVSAATASDAVSTLVAKGLVKKVRAADDRRALALSLTPEGRALASAAADASGSLLAQSLKALTPDDKLDLLRVVVKIIGTMQERGEISISRMCMSCNYYDGNKSDDPALPHHCNLVGSAFADHHIRIDCPEHLSGFIPITPIK